MSYSEEALAHGVARHRAGHLTEARSVYESLISHSLDSRVSGAALSHLASLHLRENRVNEARMAATQALRKNEDNGTALWTWSKCERRLGRAETALDTLQRRSTHGLPPQLLHEMGLCHEALGEYRKAFLCFKEAKRRISFTDLDINRNLLLRYIEQTTHAAAPDSTVWDDAHEPSDRESPTFIVGFNESGVSELGQMLGQHPAIRLAAELPGLVHARLQLNGKDPSELNHLKAEEVESARTAYFKTIDDVVPGKGHIVDALPTNLLAVHVIKRIFPDANIIHCVRNPLDAVIDTFVRPYGLNNVTCHFDRLERTALTYAGIDALVHKFRSTDSIDMVTLRYEELMNHPNEIVRAIVHDAGITDSGTTKLAPRSPVPRWVNYRKELTRWIPVLQPIAERLGYPAK